MLKQEAQERKFLVGKLFFSFFFFEKMVGKLKKNINLMFWSGYIEEAVIPSKKKKKRGCDEVLRGWL